MIDEQIIKDFKKHLQTNTTRIEEEKQVIEKYGQLFNPTNLKNLTKETFKSFLLMKNNRHWESIHRQSNMITSDMERLKKGLNILFR